MGILQLQRFADVRVFNKNAAFLWVFFVSYLGKRNQKQGKIDERIGCLFSINGCLQLIPSS